MPIRPIKALLDERPQTAKIKQQAHAIDQLQRMIVASLPMRIRAVSQLEMSIQLYGNQCFVSSANGTLCHALRSQQQQITKLVLNQLPNISSVKIRKYVQQQTSSPTGSALKYWQTSEVDLQTVTNIETAASYTSNKQLGQALHNLANTLKAHTKKAR